MRQVLSVVLVCCFGTLAFAQLRTQPSLFGARLVADLVDRGEGCVVRGYAPTAHVLPLVEGDKQDVLLVDPCLDVRFRRVAYVKEETFSQGDIPTRQLKYELIRHLCKPHLAAFDPVAESNDALFDAFNKCRDHLHKLKIVDEMISLFLLRTMEKTPAQVDHLSWVRQIDVTPLSEAQVSKVGKWLEDPKHKEISISQRSQVPGFLSFISRVFLDADMVPVRETSVWRKLRQDTEIVLYRRIAESEGKIGQYRGNPMRIPLMPEYCRAKTTKGCVTFNCTEKEFEVNKDSVEHRVCELYTNPFTFMERAIAGMSIGFGFVGSVVSAREGSRLFKIGMRVMVRDRQYYLYLDSYRWALNETLRLAYHCGLVRARRVN